MVFYKYLVISLLCGMSFAKAAENGTGPSGADRQFAAETEMKKRADKSAKQKSKSVYKKYIGIKGPMLLRYRPIETLLGAVDRSPEIGKPIERSAPIANLSKSFLATMPQEFENPLVEQLKAEGFSEEAIYKVLGLGSPSPTKIDVAELQLEENQNSAEEIYKSESILI